MTARLLFVVIMTAILSAQTVAQRAASDPLSDAEAIVMAAGPIPAALKPAQLLAIPKNQLLPYCNTLGSDIV